MLLLGTFKQAEYFTFKTDNLTTLNYIIEEIWHFKWNHGIDVVNAIMGVLSIVFKITLNPNILFIHISRN